MNTWDASIHAAAFLGDHYEYELEAGSVQLVVQTSRAVDGPRIKVHIPRDACAVVE
jgi:hypothetical protein